MLPYDTMRPYKDPGKKRLLVIVSGKSFTQTGKIPNKKPPPQERRRPDNYVKAVAYLYFGL